MKNPATHWKSLNRQLKKNIRHRIAIPDTDDEVQPRKPSQKTTKKSTKKPSQKPTAPDMDNPGVQPAMLDFSAVLNAEYHG